MQVQAAGATVEVDVRTADGENIQSTTGELLSLEPDAVLLLAPRRADDQALRDALMPLVGSIDVKLMQQANLRADREEDKQTPAQAARWLWEQISGARPSN